MGHWQPASWGCDGGGGRVSSYLCVSGSGVRAPHWPVRRRCAAAGGGPSPLAPASSWPPRTAAASPGNVPDWGRYGNEPETPPPAAAAPARPGPGPGGGPAQERETGPRGRNRKPQRRRSGSHLGVPTAPSVSDWSPPALELLLPVTMVAVWQAKAMVRGRARHPAFHTIIAPPRGAQLPAAGKKLLFRHSNMSEKMENRQQTGCISYRLLQSARSITSAGLFPLSHTD